MIILPVEKRFNGKKPPLVLISIILLNIIIFFFHQMNDDEKWLKAFSAYQKQSLFAIEWPLYQDYLKATGQDEHYQQLLEQQKQGFEAMVVYQLINDNEFYHYLQQRPELLTGIALYQWQSTRDTVSYWVSKTSTARFALVPTEQNLYTFISYQFMHGGFMHLMGNLFFLIVCGFAVEAAIGHWRFLAFYLLGGIAGGIGHILVSPESNAPLVGASASISAVMALYLGVFQFKKIEFFYWVYIFVGYFRAPALAVLPLYLIKEIVSFYTAGGQVAYMAHLGGFIAGALCIGALLWLKPELLNKTYIEQDDSIDPARENYANILQSVESFHFNKALQDIETELEKQEDCVNNMALQALKIKLLFWLNDPSAKDHALNFIQQKTQNSQQLQHQSDIYQLLNDNGNNLSHEQLLTVGLKLCNLSNISAAESIFKQLYQKQFQHKRMAIFAGRLAYFYQQNQHANNAQYYQNIVDNEYA